MSYKYNLFKVLSCDNCQSNFNFSIKATTPLQPIKVLDKPWYLCGMDMIGPLQCSPDGFQYILTMTDYFTKFVATWPLKTKNASEVATSIFSIYCNYGAPVRIITDNDPTFTSTVSCNSTWYKYLIIQNQFEGKLWVIHYLYRLTRNYTLNVAQNYVFLHLTTHRLMVWMNLPTNQFNSEYSEFL